MHCEFTIKSLSYESLTHIQYSKYLTDASPNTTQEHSLYTRQGIRGNRITIRAGNEPYLIQNSVILEVSNTIASNASINYVMCKPKDINIHNIFNMRNL